MNLLRIAARVAGEPVVAVPEGGMDISFTGTLRSRFDGENNSADGKVVIDGVEHDVSVNASSSDRGAHYSLDGEEVEWESPLHEQLDLYFTDIWPPESGSWDAVVDAGVIANPPTPVEDEEDEEDPGPPSDPGSPYDTLEEKKGLK